MKKLESLKSAKFNKLSNIELAKVNGGLKEYPTQGTEGEYDPRTGKQIGWKNDDSTGLFYV